MKKKIFVLCICFMFLLCGCGNNKANKNLDISEIRAIADLSTVKMYYHNVAKLEKKKGSGLLHLFEKDRKLWIEYTGVIKLGVDMTEVDMTVDGNKVHVYVPKAKVLSVDYLERKSIIYSKDGWNSNKITLDEETQIIANAQDEMKKTAENDSKNLLLAQSRAKDLIEQYIIQIGDLSGVEYEITWELEK